jgi:hypothetical protein
MPALDPSLNLDAEWVAAMPPLSARRLRVARIPSSERSSAKSPYRRVNAQDTALQPLYISGLLREKLREERRRPICAAIVPAARRINSRSRNIFNGLLRVPVNEIIPALNSI